MRQVRFSSKDSNQCVKTPNQVWLGEEAREIQAKTQGRFNAAQELSPADPKNMQEEDKKNFRYFSDYFERLKMSQTSTQPPTRPSSNG